MDDSDSDESRLSNIENIRIGMDVESEDGHKVLNVRTVTVKQKRFK